jgi:hypothetical protein
MSRLPAPHRVNNSKSHNSTFHQQVGNEQVEHTASRFRTQNLPYETLVYLCDLVVRVHGYRSKDGGSILGATRFSRK